MSEFIPSLYRGMSWVFLYLSYLMVLFAVLGVLIGSNPSAIRDTITSTVVAYVFALLARLMAWAFEDFIYGSFREWNAS